MVLASLSICGRPQRAIRRRLGLYRSHRDISGCGPVTSDVDIVTETIVDAFLDV